MIRAFRVRLGALLWSAAMMLPGAAYAVHPYDLLDDRRPYGYLDEIAIAVLFAIGLLFLTTARLRESPAVREAAIRLALFRVRVLRADLANFATVQHRYVDGFLVSAKNSGSHWLKFMLSVALARQHGLALPRYSTGPEADAIVGRACRQRSGRGFPQIATSHTIPSLLLTLLPRRLLREPPIVLLVRSIPEALRSNYLKWRRDYGVPVAEFLRGDPWGRRYVADPWWYIHFFNRWGDLRRHDPDRILVVRYEDMLAEPALWLRRVADHLNLGLDQSAIAAAVSTASKDRMRTLQDPESSEVVIPDDDVASPPLSASDWLQLKAMLTARLRHEFGYALPSRNMKGRRRAEAWIATPPPAARDDAA